jgi:hypothetical protein
MLNANELHAMGRELKAKGNLVVYLYPSQVWMAVKCQTPYLKYYGMKYH